MKIRCLSPFSDGKLIEAFLSVLPEDYPKTGQAWELIGAVNEENEVLGLLAFADDGDRFRITHLFVGEEYRRQGVATALLEEIISMIEEGLFFQDLEAEFTSMQEDLLGFFENNPHFRVRHKSDIFFYTAAEVLKNPAVEAFRKRPGKKAEAFFDQEDSIKNALLNRLKKAGRLDIEDRNLWEEKCFQDLCLCTKDEKGQIDSAVFVEKRGEKCLVLSYLWIGAKEKSITLLSGLCRLFAEKCQDCYLAIEPVNSAGGDLMTRMLGPAGETVENLMAFWNYM